MRLVYGGASDSAFIALREISFGESVKQVTLHDDSLAGHIVVHLDKEDRVIGLEFPRNARAMLPTELFD